jgi:hypothetical protein
MMKTKFHLGYMVAKDALVPVSIFERFVNIAVSWANVGELGFGISVAVVT